MTDRRRVLLRALLDSLVDETVRYRVESQYEIDPEFHHWLDTLVTSLPVWVEGMMYEAERAHALRQDELLRRIRDVSPLP